MYSCSQINMYQQVNMYKFHINELQIYISVILGEYCRCSMFYCGTSIQ